MEFFALAAQCAPNFRPEVMAALADTESDFNPYAIGVVRGSIKQPRNYYAAVQAVQKLRSQKKNFSAGIMQINRYNFEKYGLNDSTVFDPCKNMQASNAILHSCYTRALKKQNNKNRALQMAFSCYYSGNFKTGFYSDFKGQPPYVTKVTRNLNKYSRSKNYVARYNQRPIPKNKYARLVSNNKNASIDSRKISLANYATNLMTQPKNDYLAKQDDAEISIVANNQRPTDTSTDTSTKKEREYHAWDVFKEF